MYIVLCSNDKHTNRIQFIFKLDGFGTQLDKKPKTVLNAHIFVCRLKRKKIHQKNMYIIIYILQ